MRLRPVRAQEQQTGTHRSPFDGTESASSDTPIVRFSFRGPLPESGLP